MGKENMVLTRKFKLVIVNENEELKKQQYKFIRDSIYAQYLGLNRCMGYLVSGYYANNMDIKSKGFEEHQDSITNSLFIFDGIEFGKGIDSKSSIVRKVKKDFKTALKNGLASGERSTTNYKRTFPLMTRGKHIKIYEKNEEYYIKWVNGITFKIILSYKTNKNYIELQHHLRKILNEEYILCQSSLYFNKKNKLMINLCAKMPIVDNDIKFEPGRIVGVDLGMKIPAYCSLNDSNYIREALGNIEEMTKVRIQFRQRRRRLLKKLGMIQGYKKRYKSVELDKLNSKEHNYALTYNHKLTKRIIEFAKKNKAGQINLELLSIDKGEENGVLISLWGYYQIKTLLEYKAKKEGIKIAYVDPYHTSQTCSICGHYEKGQRIDQETFICKNDKCKAELNADFNASRNIAKSTKYITEKEDSEYYKKHKNDDID